MAADPTGLNIFSLHERVFIVTGATQGIGLAIATALASAGALVGINARTADTVHTVAASIEGAFPLAFDVTDPDAAESAVQTVLSRYGRLDGLVSNAGMRDRRPYQDIGRDAFHAMLDVNLVGPFVLAQIASRPMAARGSGRLIFISSIAARRPSHGGTHYPVSKAALEALVPALARILGSSGITVNAISPGYIATPFNEAFMRDPAIGRTVASGVPLGRWGRPDEVAAAAVFLASDAASYVSGHVLTVDGGMLAGAPAPQ